MGKFIITIKIQVRILLIMAYINQQAIQEKDRPTITRNQWEKIKKNHKSINIISAYRNIQLKTSL